jgi:DNA-directed RNA polymerase specialized sigma24 family protein
VPSRHRSVRILLDALPKEQRPAIVLVYYRSLRVREAAEFMRTSVKALESPLGRAGSRLSGRLDPAKWGLPGAWW